MAADSKISLSLRCHSGALPSLTITLPTLFHLFFVYRLASINKLGLRYFDNKKALRVLYDADVIFCEPKIIFIGWALWGDWSDCSETCGDGTRQRSRVCQPSDSVGIPDCLGPQIDMEPCNIEDCPGDIG